MNELILLEAFACVFMTGLIWLVQLVHYPSFEYVAESKFLEFHRMHSSRITWVVLPVMGAELLLAIALVWLDPRAAWVVNLSGVGLLWLLTAFVSVPLHNQLGKAADRATCRRLVATNWARTVVWSARSLFLIYVIAA